MRNLLLLLAGVVILSPAAFAGVESESLQSVDQIESEDAVSDFLGLKTFNDRGRHRPPPPPRRRPYPPRNPGYPGYPGYPDAPGRSYYICYAENARGYQFSGSDRSVRWAEREALDNCMQVSVRCYPLGCRRY